MDDYTESPELALAAARRAAEAMTLHGVVPHPRNYALWYVYCAGTLLPLNRAIESTIRASDPRQGVAEEPASYGLPSVATPPSG